MINDIKNNFFMLKYIWKARKSYIFIEFFKALINSLLEVTSIMLFKYFIDMLNNGMSIYVIIPIIIFYALCKKIHAFSFEYIALFQLPKTQYALNRELTNDILNKATDIDLKCYDNTEFYNQYTRALSETNDRSIRSLNTISSIIYSIVSSIGLISLILTLDYISIVLAIFIFVSYTIFTNKSKKLIFERDMELTEFNRKMSYFKSTFFSRSLAKDLRTYPGISKYIKEEFVNTSKSAEEVHMTNTTTLFKYNITKTIFLLLTEYIIPLIYFSFRVSKGLMTIGSVSAMLETITGLANNFSGIVFSFSELKQSSLYIDNLKYILNYRAEIGDNENSVKPPEKITSICFHNVSFKYEDSKDFILKNISFEINNKQKVALVGHNGAGKTTLIKLLLRFYDPTEGYITVNGINIKNFILNEYRKLFISMFQDYSLFSIPISVNVLTKVPSNNEEVNLVRNALCKAGLSKVISGNYINNTYSKEFENNGVVFSGGEEQKIALARLFATKNHSSVVVLDEPSSSLDVESEQIFYKNLFDEVDENIVIIISHHLSSTKDADIIFFFENGKIIEKGNHNDLIEANGQYSYVFNLQAEKYKYDDIKKEINNLQF